MQKAFCSPRSRTYVRREGKKTSKKVKNIFTNSTNYTQIKNKGISSLTKLKTPLPLVFAFCSALNVSSFYSVLSASTGSFFAARLEGTRPAIKVRNMLIPTRITAALKGS